MEKLYFNQNCGRLIFLVAKAFLLYAVLTTHFLFTMAIFLGKVYLGQREQDVFDVQNVDQHLKDIAAAIREQDGRSPKDS